MVGGGDVLYLCHWMRESGLVDLLPSLTQTVWVGLSSGSMVMTPQVGEDFIQWRPPKWGPRRAGSRRLHAVEDQTAFKVVDGEVQVISEGHWKRLSA